VEVLHLLRHKGVLAGPTWKALLLTFGIALGGCEARASGSSMAVDSAEIVLGGWGSEEHVVPSRVIVRSGGAVVFLTVDHRVHTIEFQSDSLSAPILAFLESTAQLRSPPLLARGSVYRISLAGAPPGYYPFIAEGPGPPVLGAIVVE
jgi:hypothetical protein